jgi:EF-hand domain pair/EF hand
MRRMGIALGMASLLYAGGVSAQQGSPPVQDPRAAFAITDKNGDGQIDHAEFQQRVVDVFYFADKDKDGLAKRGEMGVWDEQALFDRADKDGDGQISVKEFVAARFEDFEQADTDHSGTLSVEEVVAEFERRP